MADESTHPEDQDPDQAAPDAVVAGGVAGAICTLVMHTKDKRADGEDADT